ncbi:hypothetical protein [Desulfosporosinus sp.]|uniref:hypothetical protein n=1 Tax=Desulfosporosinus sp. TaxID=157907 RepID=UPI0025BAA170|nr:hypothetical protein [Desulfosporosinus sp.]MBC2726056.1 hypothetical protein [Desulfosporosinus sp.]
MKCENWTIKFFTFAIILSPFLKQYTSLLPGVTLGDVTLGISCLFLLLSLRFNNITKKIIPLLLLWLFGTFVTLCSVFIQQELTFEIATRFIRYSFYVFLVLIASNNFNLKYALKIYRVLCILTSTYIIVQVIIYNSAGMILPYKLLPIPWASGNTFGSDYVISIAQKYYYRPSGIFIEPGYAAQFLLPGLSFSLFGWMKLQKVDIKGTLIIFTALTLSTSSQGIFIGVSILGLYVLSFIRTNENYYNLLKKLVIMSVSVVVLIFFLKLDVVQSSINKVTGEIRGGSSVSLRIFRGIAVYKELPILFKIVGVGHGNLGNYVMRNGISTQYDPAIITPATADYANGVSTVLLYYGIFGFFLLVNLYWSFLRNTNNAFRLIAITQIILTLVEGAFFDVSIVFYFSFVYAGYYTIKQVKVKGEL